MAPVGPRRELSPEKLIVAALRLIDREGAGAISMRRLAAAVGVTPMAIYNHFASKRDLLAAVADHVISATRFDGGHDDWRDQVRHCFEALRGLCLRHPGLPALLEVDGAAPASVFAPMEATVQALRQAGLDDVDSVRAYFLLIGFTLSQAAYQARAPIAALEPSEQNRAGCGYPDTEQLELPPSWDFDASFAFGLTLILDGIAVSARQPPEQKAG